MDIDWYAHYADTLPSLQFAPADLKRFFDQDRLFIEAVLSYAPASALEAGTGLARDALVLANRGVAVTVLDKDERLLALAKTNAAALCQTLSYIHGDFFNLASLVPPDSFDVVFHSGVLEHYDDDQIRSVLSEQLRVAPRVVFSVPIHSRRNESYFSDNLYRRLLPAKTWKTILSPFTIERAEPITTRHDDLLVVLRRT